MVLMRNKENYHQALFSSKDKSKKKIKVLSAAILLGALRGMIIVVNYDLSVLIISGPSEVEIARENEVKRGITEAVSKALKAVQKENINTEDRAVYRSVTIQF